VRRYLRDPTFSRFDTIPECDGHTHTHTHTYTHTHRRTDTRRRHIPRLARRRAVKTLYAITALKEYRNIFYFMHRLVGTYSQSTLAYATYA